MNLVEPVYLVFLVGVALLVRLAARVAPARGAVACLVAASLFFYAAWNPWYLVPLLVTTLLDFHVAEALAKKTRPAPRRALLALSLFVNLSLLALFKYGNLAAETLSIALPFRVVFAAGISFYTFQSMSYVLDVYRGDREPTPSLLDYVAFVSFFPTLLAGPITRADTLLPQISRLGAPLDAAQGGRALFLIALGFFKKCVLADLLAVDLVNRVFDIPGLYSSGEVLTGLYAYSVQIYCDFSGYSDVAIGSALLLGVALKENFASPYRAADLTEFWRRWHISFSTWLRDYLFFSLPGKRPGSVFPYLNLVVTFVLGGLWHGASWTFAVWGLMHGVGLAALRLADARRRARGERFGPRPAWRRVVGVLGTFHFVTASWVFFRCATLAQARDVFRALFAGVPGFANVTPVLLLAIGVGLAGQLLPEGFFRRVEERFVALPAVAQAALLLGTAAFVRHASGSAVAPFIYFGF